MSSDGWAFKDRKSMAVTLLVIAILLVCMYFAYKANRQSLLTSRLKRAQAVEEEMVGLMDRRFSLAAELSTKVSDLVLTKDVDQALRDWQVATSPEARCIAYRRLDEALSPLERALVGLPLFEEVSPLFGQMAAMEDELTEKLALWQEAARDYERRLSKGDAKWGFIPLGVYDFGPALATRP